MIYLPDYDEQDDSHAADGTNDSIMQRGKTDRLSLIRRIENLHGTHAMSYAEQLGLGTQRYTLLDISQSSAVAPTTLQPIQRYNVFDLEGRRLLSNAASLDNLPPGTYIINGQKQVIR